LTAETTKRPFLQIRGGAGGDDRLAALCACMTRWAAERGSRDDISLVCVELSAADWRNPTQPPGQIDSRPPAPTGLDSAVEPGPHTIAQRMSLHEPQAVVGASSSAARPPLSGQRREDDGGTTGDRSCIAQTPRTFEESSMDISTSSVVPTPPQIVGMDSDASQPTAPEPACLNLQVVAATRGGDASDEWTGDLVRISGAIPTDIASLPTMPGPQLWNWGDRAGYEVSFCPANDGGSIGESGGGVEWLVEMCALFCPRCVRASWFGLSQRANDLRGTGALDWHAGTPRVKGTCSEGGLRYGDMPARVSA